MSRRSLQEIEDFYIQQGLQGESLWEALDKDEEFHELLKQKKQQIREKHNITSEEEQKYLLPTENDYEILAKIKALETYPLTKEDKTIVGLIKSQLQEEWRKPLLSELNNLIKTYSARRNIV